MSQRYEGKAKVVEQIAGAEGKVRVTFKDDATAGNGAMKDSFEGKGVLCNEITCLLFEYLESQGVETHYLGRESDTAFLAHHVEIVLVEVVVRNLAAGSMCRRLGIESGLEIDPPVVEFYYKDDDLGDPLMTRDHVGILQLATPEELDQITVSALQVNKAMSDLFARAGLQLVDFKLEYGRTADGELLLADEFSPDTCRLWLNGESLDKDVFRRGDGSPLAGYREVLRRIRPLLAESAA
ncbi:MAG: phosphoribosylaminoimidazolesuccinocarboxamide synthase [Acidobacteriota bacterium]